MEAEEQTSELLRENEAAATPGKEEYPARTGNHAPVRLVTGQLPVSTRSEPSYCDEIRPGGIFFAGWGASAFEERLSHLDLPVLLGYCESLRVKSGFPPLFRRALGAGVGS